jgi:Diacylglycerol acyltransferase
MAATTATAKPRTRARTWRWYVGMLQASIFSMTYFIAPFYIVSANIAVLWYRSSWAWMYASPLILSLIFPPTAMPFLFKFMTPMLEYFDYEEIMEDSPVNVRQLVLEGSKNYLCVFQPHGALSYCGICSLIAAPQILHDMQGFPTAVADALLYTPILKHVMGIFRLISASKSSMQHTLRHQKGASGCVVLYVGGMAELFLSCENKERLFLKQRKGFIKLALTEGVDIVPVYLFGNTTVLSVWKNPLLMSLSRTLQVSLTYIWGQYGLPVPRPLKLLYVSGQPLGLPRIEHPTLQDIDKYHAQYCEQVTRLFEKYKEKVPEYKHKTLEIL